MSDFATPWIAALQASLSITTSWSSVKSMSIESVMPSNHLILCHPLLLPSIFPSIRVFSNESVLHIRWSKYWSFSFSISPSSEHSGLISSRMDWFDPLAVQGTLESSLAPQFESINPYQYLHPKLFSEGQISLNQLPLPHLQHILLSQSQAEGIIFIPSPKPFLWSVLS